MGEVCDAVPARGIVFFCMQKTECYWKKKVLFYDYVR